MRERESGDDGQDLAHAPQPTALATQVSRAQQTVIALLADLADLADLAAQIDASRQPDTLPPLLPLAEEGNLPLSYAQQRLWFLHQLAPDNGTYNIPVAARLSGALNCRALEQALAEVVSAEFDRIGAVGSADAFGAKLEVDSAPDRGTRMIVVLRVQPGIA